MIKIDRNYTDYRDDTDPKYPGGKAVNATTAEGTDGTPLLADWMNDINGALQALFLEAFGDINKVSGKPDNVQESDVLKAIKKITQEYTDKTNNAESQARTQGDASTLREAKRYTNDLLIKIFQNGYIQWPGMPTPDTLFTFEGYRWAEVNYDGCFFRAKGKGAHPFGGEEQGDAIRNIKGFLGIEGTFNFSAPFYQETPARQKVDSWQDYTEAYKRDEMGFDASLVVPTAEENRPRNRTFIIWKLEKIEE